ncbi:pyridoxal-phosphate-dependent aminotransferase family protein [Bacillus daqingensis]|uniref:Pyridoxal-phosphate-dependent aminotransferase family protein n=1 Tax=Bacillus daqingensis TaxID=872396 RepID=A0ABV9NX17_9BACI
MTMNQSFIPPKRTIMTPGPVEADPRVLQALSSPIIGQFDPMFTDLMNQTMKLVRNLYQTDNEWSFPIDGTSRAGMEALMVSLIEPGDRVLVPIYGRFGYLLAEIAERCGADVRIIETEWGSVFEERTIIQAVHDINPVITAVVHGETSTGCMQPLLKTGAACREHGSLFLVDATATIGGVEFRMDDWYVDAVAGGTQKCISGPSGTSPVSFNSRAAAKMNPRKQVERGIRTEHDAESEAPPVRSNYFDLTQLQDYWSPRRLNHHTEATSMLYALYEALRVIQTEGLEERFSRHLLHEEAIIAGVKAMGLEVYNNHEAKLPVVTCIRVPEGIDEEAVRQLMLDEFGVEIASSFGPLKGMIWRIGSMGYSARKENVYHVLFALESALSFFEAPVITGRAAAAAMEVYRHAAAASLSR